MFGIHPNYKTSHLQPCRRFWFDLLQLLTYLSTSGMMWVMSRDGGLLQSKSFTSISILKCENLFLVAEMMVQAL